MVNVFSICDMFFDFNDVFSLVFNDFLGVLSYLKVDLVENEKEYKLIVDMFGCDKEDMIVEYLDNILMIFVNYEFYMEDKENGNYVWKERYLVFYKCLFYFFDVDEEKIIGIFKNGVLKLVLFKMVYYLKEMKKIELN